LTDCAIGTAVIVPNVPAISVSAKTYNIAAYATPKSGAASTVVSLVSAVIAVFAVARLTM
jgi:hypothetical protein